MKFEHALIGLLVGVEFAFFIGCSVLLFRLHKSQRELRVKLATLSAAHNLLKDSHDKLKEVHGNLVARHFNLERVLRFYLPLLEDDLQAQGPEIPIEPWLPYTLLDQNYEKSVKAEAKRAAEKKESEDRVRVTDEVERRAWPIYTTYSVRLNTMPPNAVVEAVVPPAVEQEDREPPPDGWRWSSLTPGAIEPVPGVKEPEKQE
jgi:hypothetical protein